MRQLMWKIHRFNHWSQHQGIDRTRRMISKFSYWYNMYADIIGAINQCEICKQVKTFPLKFKQTQLPMLRRKFDCVKIDTFRENALSKIRGFSSVLVLMDRLTNFVILVPLRQKSWAEISKALLERSIMYLGPPRILLGNNAFDCASHRHTGNGSVERFNRYLKEQLLATNLETRIKNWVEVLPRIAARYNAGHMTSIKTSPFFLLFGTDMKVWKGQPLGTERSVHRVC